MGTVDRGTTHHERYLPSADLGLYIEHFWSVSWDFRDLDPFLVQTLPYPSVHIVIDPGRSRVAGVTRGRFERWLTDQGWVFGIKFHPGAFAPFFGAPVSQLTDRMVSVERIFGLAGKRLELTVVAAEDDDAKVERAEELLRARLPEPDDNVALAKQMVELIRTDRRVLKVDDLVNRMQVNKRAVQRLFSRYVGVSPKWVIQRFRLHEAAEQLATGAADGSRLALELGYADQAHFIRDFKAMVGVAPGAYAKRAAVTGKR